jgi:hypothetical protein
MELRVVLLAPTYKLREKTYAGTMTARDGLTITTARLMVLPGFPGFPVTTFYNLLLLRTGRRGLRCPQFEHYRLVLYSS